MAKGNGDQPGQTRVIVSEGGDTMVALDDPMTDRASDLVRLIEDLPFSDDALAPLVAMLDQMIAEKAAEFAVVEKQYKMISESLRRMRQMRRFAVPEPKIEPQSKNGGANRKDATGKGVSVEVLATARKWLSNQTEPVTVRQLREGTGLTNSKADSAMRVMRNEGMVRMTGYAKTQGAAAALYLITEDGRS